MNSNWHFTKEESQTSKQHVKRCPVLLAIRELQIKTMWYTKIPSLSAKIKKPKNTKC